jgi:hypothetical protein
MTLPVGRTVRSRHAMRLGGWLALLAIAAHGGCTAGPTDPTPRRVPTLEPVPNPIVGTWERNPPKFPTSNGTGYHVAEHCLFCVHAGHDSGLSIITVATHVGSGTGYDHYHGSRYVPAGTTTCLAPSTVLGVGPFTVDVDLVDDRGNGVRLHADGQVLPPATPAPADGASLYLR